jgi:hypothetical protein
VALEGLRLAFGPHHLPGAATALGLDRAKGWHPTVAPALEPLDDPVGVAPLPTRDPNERAISRGTARDEDDAAVGRVRDAGASERRVLEFELEFVPRSNAHRPAKRW